MWTSQQVVSAGSSSFTSRTLPSAKSYSPLFQLQAGCPASLLVRELQEVRREVRREFKQDVKPNDLYDLLACLADMEFWHFAQTALPILRDADKDRENNQSTAVAAECIAEIKEAAKVFIADPRITERSAGGGRDLSLRCRTRSRSIMLGGGERAWVP